MADDLASFGNKLTRSASSADRWVAAGVLEVGREAERMAAPRQPVLTGTLRNSLGIDATGGALGVTLFLDTVYAGFIEFGGAVGIGGSVTRPYVPRGRTLGPSMEAALGRSGGALEKALQDGFEDVGLDV